MTNFLQNLHTQRMDDHRYYHHSRINQALHFISAISFVVAYAFLFIEPAWSALIAWFISMPSRQAGHFFFEPRGYDEVNQATHEHKEDIKVGYNLQRKVVLMSLWALIPVTLYFNRSFFGMFEATGTWQNYFHSLGILWLWLGAGGLLFRTVHLFFLQNVQTGLVWMTKIITDPFHDIKLYHKAPLFLLKGELIDPMHHVRENHRPSQAA
ncbi:MAG: hypothetical protein RL514_1323 [Verrucomicrobiota bacterium]|jgi:hypothetical protein